MELIKQRSKIDCGICSLSMALDKSYEEITLVPNSKYGVSVKMMTAYLTSIGASFTVNWDWEEDSGPEFKAELILISGSRIRDEDMQLDVDQTNYGYHWVVLDKDGKVFDSATKPRNFGASLKIVSIGIY